jgi:transposase
MSSPRYTPEFKDEAVRQIVDRGYYSVAEVSQRLGVSAHSLYKWVKAVKPDQPEAQAAELTEAKREILQLRAQLRRTEEERDILKKPRGTLPRSPSEVQADVAWVTDITYSAPNLRRCH